MGKQRTILAIDHGTSGVKASLVSTHGRILASDAEKTPSSSCRVAVRNRTPPSGGMPW